MKEFVSGLPLKPEERERRSTLEEALQKLGTAIEKRGARHSKDNGDKDEKTEKRDAASSDAKRSQEDADRGGLRT